MAFTHRGESPVMLVQTSADGTGRAEQVEPVKPMLKAPGKGHLKLKCDILLSSSA